MQGLAAARPLSRWRVRTSASVRGMTLIEILVVLTLIGIVMGIVGGNYLGQGEKAKQKARKRAPACAIASSGARSIRASQR